ncbi:hypothetical protein E3N88_28521 [Mikania micrantha]|uniref:Uncharacterized protein n=1 Tax=Mikania micrantha TaxID=192012 RepID=A0A5N6N0W0_9ASTR|nr:hypothetical protein E3N88_28521 [Mikania micrantha]
MCGKRSNELGGGFFIKFLHSRMLRQDDDFRRKLDNGKQERAHLNMQTHEVEVGNFEKTYLGIGEELRNP